MDRPGGPGEWGRKWGAGRVFPSRRGRRIAIVSRVNVVLVLFAAFPSRAPLAAGHLHDLFSVGNRTSCELRSDLFRELLIGFNLIG